MTGSVFGQIGNVSGKVGIALFEITIAALIIIQLFLDYLENLAERNDLKDLHEKVKGELLQLGMISFLLFLAQSSGIQLFQTSEYFLAFELTHIVVLFIAFAFVIQACFLIEYACFANRSYLLVTRLDITVLLRRYKDFSESSGWFAMWRYNYAPSWTILAPCLRLDMESKIFERIMLSSHRFSPDFNSAKYMNKLFKKYIASIGEISTTSWLALACCGLLNYVRITTIDPHIMGHICTNSRSTPHHGNDSQDSQTQAHAMSASDDSHTYSSDGNPPTSSSDHHAMLCPESVLIYAFVLSVMLSLFMMCLFAVSIRYYNEIVKKHMKEHGIDWDVVGNKGFNDFLNHLIATGRDKSTRHQSVKEVAAVTAHDEKRKMHQQLAGRLQNVTQKAKAALLMFATRKVTNASNCDSEYIRNEKMKCIFLFGAPSIYFTFVELGVFFQCFYIAIVATQLLPVALHTDREVAWWFAFCLPVILNFYMMRQTLHKSVLIQSVVQLDKRLFGAVCEEMAFEEETVATLGKRIKLKMAKLGFPESDRVSSIKNIFDMYDEDGSGTLDKFEFLDLLGDLDIHMTPESFEILWECLDYDLSGYISWDELAPIVFPEMRTTFGIQRDIAGKVRKDMQSIFKGKENDALEKNLRRQFDSLDTDHSGFLSKSEFGDMIRNLGVKLPQRSLDALFDSLVSKRDRPGSEFDEGKISFEDFKALVCPELGFGVNGDGRWDEEKGDGDTAVASASSAELEDTFIATTMKQLHRTLSLQSLPQSDVGYPASPHSVEGLIRQSSGILTSFLQIETLVEVEAKKDDKTSQDFFSVSAEATTASPSLRRSHSLNSFFVLESTEKD